MRKTLTYTSFTVACLIIALIFVTAKNYTQLTVGVLLYFPLAYLALSLFPARTRKSSPKETTVEPNSIENSDTGEEYVIADSDKREFLKLIGVAGVTFFLSSLFSRKSGVFPLFGNNAQLGTTGLEDSTGRKVNPAESHPTDGYKISEIDDNEISYYGFTNKDGAWLIMRENTDTKSFRYAKGEFGFPESWSDRQNLNYDYYHNVF
jgi:hypothetical protein